MDTGLLLVLLGVGGGLLSGMLGIGGGIIMTPLLLYVAGLDMRAVAGLTIVQSLFSALSGVLIHRKFKHVHWGLLAYMGPTTLAASLAGALVSRYVSGHLLLGLFAALAFVAAVVMLVPCKEGDGEATSDTVSFNRWLALGVAGSVGFVGGMVGQSGAFILIPMMLQVLRVPTRVTIGTSLGVILCAAAAGTAGKVLTGQVPYGLTGALVFGTLVGAHAGARLSHKIPTRSLRAALALLIALSAARMWWDVLHS